MSKIGRRLLIAAVVATTCVGGAAGLTAPAGASAPHHVWHYGPPNDPAHGGSKTLPTVSHNWSGYAVSSHTPFTYVHSTFVQPAISCPGIRYQWTSNWVGLDGFTNGTVEQDGTFAHCGGAGYTTPMYQAWYEMYPAGSVSVFPVQPGDIMDVSVSADANSNFALTVVDLTSGKHVTKTATCTQCARTSAEWIIERPALCTGGGLTDCFLTELADFGTSTLTGDQAQVQGHSVRGLSSFSRADRIYMIDTDPSGGFISLDSVAPQAGKSFTTTWIRWGNTYPIQL